MRVLLCPLSDGGYLYPAITVGRELARRGHTVGAVGRGRAAPLLAAAGIPFVSAEELGGRAGFAAARWAPTGVEQFRITRRAAVDLRADVLVTSVLSHGALLAAEVLRAPVVVVGLATHLWDYAAGGADEPLRPARAERTRDMLRHHADLRERIGLRPRRQVGDVLLGTALLLRGSPALEHPGAVLPERVHHVGPLGWEPEPEPAALDAVRAALAATGKPVVYVHLGRTFGGTDLWPALNAAFTGGTHQAVVELGRTRDPRPDPRAAVTIVRAPWMRPYLDLADLVLGNGTSAPVLAALHRGRPLALAPNGSEQPFVTAACVRAGVAVLFDPAAGDPAAQLLAAAGDPLLRERAGTVGAGIGADGSAAAADLVERAVAGAGAVAREAAR